MKPGLLVLAAGMGSRYGGLKQMDSFGPNGETIIEYSVYDAIRSGFGYVVFVIRKQFEEAFKERFEPVFKGKIEVKYAFQEINSGTGKEKVTRTKPWGTAHAVLVAKEEIEGPFAVINADDFYGRSAFQQTAVFLSEKCTPDLWAMVGYELGRTLSKHGMVNRGIATVGENKLLLEIHERLKIQQKSGAITYLEGEERFPLKKKDQASMNFFGFHPKIFDHLTARFELFMKENNDNPTAEFFIPLIVNQLLQEGLMKMVVLPSRDQWHGVTYPEDRPHVQGALQDLIREGIYPENLWKD